MSFTCVWWLHHGQSVPVPTMFLRCSHPFPGALTPSETGSLSCTGLGYWVVFDVFGVALSRIIPGYLAGDSMQSRSRRTYGYVFFSLLWTQFIEHNFRNGRLETVLMFAQSVYLIFALVSICKEMVEHLLLSAGDDQQHHADHHHHSDGYVVSLILIS